MGRDGTRGPSLSPAHHAREMKRSRALSLCVIDLACDSEADQRLDHVILALFFFNSHHWVLPTLVPELIFGTF